MPAHPLRVEPATLMAVGGVALYTLLFTGVFAAFVATETYLMFDSTRWAFAAVLASVAVVALMMGHAFIPDRIDLLAVLTLAYAALSLAWSADPAAGLISLRQGAIALLVFLHCRRADALSLRAGLVNAVLAAHCLAAPAAFEALLSRTKQAVPWFAEPYLLEANFALHRRDWARLAAALAAAQPLIAGKARHAAEYSRLRDLLANKAGGAKP
ncbi:MAG: hypothetical protein QF578_09255 [Alphaproteobacteria bacterium]|jgi:hypothetical protein|nr:hypothetical protein [Alphaproteobacteria bacterium]MDP6564999.1 hypothetical protein [Alphaproteobacteria bacterium]MDP6816295.1 hypothetical protein [Alphaproteobacteria bacterium]